jgi:putative flippase GtrA
MLMVFRYGVVGSFGMLIHSGILILLVESFYITPVLASIPAFTIALVISHFANHIWTFQKREKLRKTFVKYATVSLLGLILNLILMHLTVNILGWSYLYGLFIVIILVSMNNYFFNKLWTFGV